MKKLLLLSALGLALMMPATSQAAALSAAEARAAGKSLPNEAKHRARCSACFTCGGRFPVFSGSLRVPAPSLVFERGSRCSGDPRIIQDSIPFICCNRG
jgi:hypothetical protein